jgi:hypothetical protein
LSDFFTITTKGFFSSYRTCTPSRIEFLSNLFRNPFRFWVDLRIHKDFADVASSRMDITLSMKGPEGSS